MHEVSLAQAVWKQVTAEIQRRPGSRLVVVHLVAGAWSGVDPESLQFAMGLLIADSPWPAATVHIRHEPLAAACPARGREFEVEGTDLACPGCGSAEAAPRRGTDLRLESLEIDEDDGETHPA